MGFPLLQKLDYTTVIQSLYLSIKFIPIPYIFKLYQRIPLEISLLTLWAILAPIEKCHCHVFFYLLSYYVLKCIYKVLNKINQSIQYEVRRKHISPISTIKITVKNQKTSGHLVHGNIRVNQGFMYLGAWLDKNLITHEKAWQASPCTLGRAWTSFHTCTKWEKT